MVPSQDQTQVVLTGCAVHPVQPVRDRALIADPGFHDLAVRGVDLHLAAPHLKAADNALRVAESFQLPHDHYLNGHPAPIDYIFQ